MKTITSNSPLSCPDYCIYDAGTTCNTCSRFSNTLLVKKEQTFKLDSPGKHYIDEIKKKCFWEVVVKNDEVMIIQRGGPLEPVVLHIKGKNLKIEDWWGRGGELI